MGISAASARSRDPQNQQDQEPVERVRYLLQEMGLTPDKQLRLHLREGLSALLQCLKDKYNAVMESIESGSLRITVRCSTLESLERLWNDCHSGGIDDMAEKCLITDEIKKELNVEDVKLKTKILEEDYLACKQSLMAISGMIEN